MATTKLSASVQAPQILDYPRGDTRVLNIQINNADGTPFDLTGSTVFFTLNASLNPTDDGTDTTAALKTSTSSFSTPTNGLAQITLTNTLTQPLSAGTYYYDVQLKDNSGNIYSLGQNTFKVVSDITTRIS
jgi:hypothetical protein